MTERYCYAVCKALEGMRVRLRIGYSRHFRDGIVSDVDIGTNSVIVTIGTDNVARHLELDIDETMEMSFGGTVMAEDCVMYLADRDAIDGEWDAIVSRSAANGGNDDG